MEENKATPIAELEKKNESPVSKDSLREYIVVKTETDGLEHTNFSSYEATYDIQNSVTPCTLICGNSGDDIVEYWTNYQGYVTIYSGYEEQDSKFGKNDEVVNIYNTGINKTEDISNPARVQNAHNTKENTYSTPQGPNNNDGLIKIFYGKVISVQKKGYGLEVIVDNIGRRFKQKIPEEFRTKYIYNQNVRDAFQAICEFIGVKFICPPHLDDPETGDLVEDQNTAENAIDTENSTAKSAVNAFDSQSSDETTDETTEVPTTTQTTNQASQGTDDGTNWGEQIGYMGIAFDQNGAICRNGAKIEENPDVLDITKSLTDTPYNLYEEKYQEYLENKENKENQEESESINIGYNGSSKSSSNSYNASNSSKSSSSSKKNYPTGCSHYYAKSKYNNNEYYDLLTNCNIVVRNSSNGRQKRIFKRGTSQWKHAYDLYFRGRKKSDNIKSSRSAPRFHTTVIRGL